MAKLDLNRATLEELRSIEGIDGARAKYLMRSRPFRTWDDVTAVDGIDDVLLRKIHGVASLGSAEAERINLNMASVDELQRLEGIDGVRANKLFEYRNRHGRFESWDDIEDVEGFDGQMVALLRRSARL